MCAPLEKYTRKCNSLRVSERNATVVLYSYNNGNHLGERGGEREGE